ncbi:MAG: hypothetical protein IJ849_11250 [Selenomonadaceae bacterium]|nr:hypothetical protein [Selenomonadaceae bacterium]
MLLETLLLTTVIVAVAGLCGFMGLSAKSLAGSGAKLKAIYLAEAQIERIRAKNDREGLTVGSQPWLGDPLEKNYRVDTEIIQGAIPGTHEIKVTVVCEVRGRRMELIFTRDVGEKGN